MYVRLKWLYEWRPYSDNYIDGDSVGSVDGAASSTSVRLVGRLQQWQRAQWLLWLNRMIATVAKAGRSYNTDRGDDWKT